MLLPLEATTALAVFVVGSLLCVEGHPLCWYGPDRAVMTSAEGNFCPNDQPEGFCCLPEEEEAIQTTYEMAVVSPTCQALYKQVLCGVCHPYSSHLYERLGTLDGMTMTNEFCNEFYSACSADLDLGPDYCDIHTGGDDDQYWSYPLDIDAGAGDKGVSAAFPDLPETSLPQEPMAMHMTPDGSKWWIGGLAGVIKEVDAADPSDAIDVLDISDHIEYSYEQGLMDFVFGPLFKTTGTFFVSYVMPGGTVPENGISVLSRFAYHEGDMVSTYASEEVLLQSSEKQTSVHSSGWVGIPPSSYVAPTPAFHDLYWTVGDGGPQNDPYNMAQDPTELHGNMIRISVPSGTALGGYRIPPSGNAFTGANGELREICATGFRNPHRCSFDKTNDKLYCGDVGQELVEEVNLVECGNDYGWRLFEGSRCNDGFDDTSCSTTTRAGHTFPIFQYCHFDYDSSAHGESFFTSGKDICGDRKATGLAIIGGFIYRGSKFADVLGGHYVFSDYSTGAIYHLAPVSDGDWEVGIILGEGPLITSFAEDQDGELYLIGYQSNIYDLPCGELCVPSGASCMDQAHEVPEYKEIGCYQDYVPRVLSLATAPSCQTMSVEMCASYCSTIQGAIYFGVEYQKECYCGSANDDYASYGVMPASACNMKCVGFPSDTCGGDHTINVYAITGGAEWGAIAPVPTPTPGPPAATPEPVAVVPTVATPWPGVAAGSETPALVLKLPSAENYMGCYVDIKHAPVLTMAYMKSDTMTEGECGTFCGSEGATVYGLENGAECYCGDDTSDFQAYGAASTGCDLPCAGDPTFSCGGYDLIAMYTIIPEGFGESDSMAIASSKPSSSSEYVGCFGNVTHARPLDVVHTSGEEMTPAKCEVFCTKRRGTVYGLEASDECWCGDLDGTSATEAAEEECNSPCSGDAQSMCGGESTASIYSVH